MVGTQGLVNESQTTGTNRFFLPGFGTGEKPDIEGPYYPDGLGQTNSTCDFGEDAASSSFRDQWENNPEWQASGIIAALLTSIAIVFCLGALFWVWIHRRKPVILVSQLSFLYSIIIGMLGINFNQLLYVSYCTPANAVCIAESIIGTLTSTLFFGAMLVKEYRALVLDRSTSRMRRMPANVGRQCLVIVSGLFVATMALLTAWLIADPPEADPCALTLCQTGTFGTVAWSYTMFLGLGVVALACKTSGISATLSESRAIRATALCILATLIVGVLIWRFTNFSAQSVKLFFSTMWFIVTVTSLGAIVLSKRKFINMSAIELRQYLLHRRKSDSFNCRCFDFCPRPVTPLAHFRSSKSESDRPESPEASNGAISGGIEIGISHHGSPEGAHRSESPARGNLVLAKC